MTADSMVTPNLSRIAGCADAVEAASLATNALSSEALCGLGFHAGTRYGAAILVCISTLAVVGTGMLRLGTVRGPGFAFVALWVDSNVAKSGAVLVRAAGACALEEPTVAVMKSKAIVESL